MKKLLIVLLFLFGFTILNAQVKKKKPFKIKVVQPPKIITETAKKTVEEEQIHYDKMVYDLASELISSEKPKIKDTILLPKEAIACECLKTDVKIFKTLGLNYGDFKGNVKKIIENERRDTTVGYWETLSKSKLSISKFNKNKLLNSSYEKSENKDYLSFKSENIYEDNSVMQLNFFYMDTTKVNSSIKLIYNNNNLLRMELFSNQDSLNKSEKPEILAVYKCYKTIDNYFASSFENHKENITKNYVKIFDQKNNLIQEKV